MRMPFGRLINKSPFPLLQKHMEASRICAEALPSLFEALSSGDVDALTEGVKRLSALEGEADDLKNQLRDQLPRGLFLSVDRRDLLQLIAEVDRVADSAEDVGVLLTLRTYQFDAELQPLVTELIDQVIMTVQQAEKCLKHLDLLVVSGFSRRAVSDAQQEIQKIGEYEHQADKYQDQAAKLLFQKEAELGALEIMMWSKVLKKLGDVANHAENVGDRMRLFLAKS